MKNLKLKIRIFFWLILSVVILRLLYLGIIPNGKISYAADFKKPDFFIGKITPYERITEADSTVLIKGDPVYFSLRTPRLFNKVKLTIKYRGSKSPAGPLEPSIIEAGLLVDKTIWRYDLKPLANKIIDQLALVWDVKKDNGLMLLQKNNSASSTLYSSINDFLNKPPASEEIALYNFDFKTDFIIADYQADSQSESASAISAPLRGDYQFYTYIKGEDLDFTFDFIDINKNKDKDPIDLNLYYRDQIIDTRHLDDYRIDDGRGNESKVRRIDFKTVGLPEGVYKIELRTNDDIITDKILTKQSKLAFINKIRLADARTRNIKLFTDSNNISAETINPGKLQEIKIEEQTLDINQTYKMFSLSVGSGVKEIVLEKPDVILAGNGVFSFSKSALINSAFKKVDGNLDVKNINYILARYEPPQEEDGWKTAEAIFDLSKAYREGGKYSFLISIPGLKTDDGIDDGVEIEKIKVELKGKTLLEKIKSIIK